MWKQAAQNLPDAGAAMDKDKQQIDSQIDSGFLSGSNLISSELSIDLDNEERRDEDLKVAPEPKKASEIGLDFGLTDSLNQLSLKEDTLLNPLDSGNVHLDTKDISIEETSSKDANDKQEQWKVYYTQDDDGDTQLHIAIIQELVEATFFLINIAPHPCLLNILNDDCQSALHLAVLTHQPRTVRRLIVAGANPAIRDFKGNTPLHLACASGDLNCARALSDPLTPAERSLLGPGKRLPPLPQDLELRNYTGEMCIHIAVLKGHIDMVRHLARLGANVEAREGLAGNTALHLAIEKKQREMVMVLLRECKFNVNVRNYAGESAHLFALRCNETHIAQELVRLGATPAKLELDDESESDSESDDEEYDSEAYIKALVRLGITPKPPAVATA